VVEADLDGDGAGDVEAGLSAGLAGAQVEVVDVGAVEFGDLVQDGFDHLPGQFVRADVFE
jgi:hypothetical protein